MKTSLFKTRLPNEIFFQLLTQICRLEKVPLSKSVFVFNTDSFQKAQYYNLFHPFLNTLKEHYHAKKHYFLHTSADSPFTYNRFTTILRHICKTNNIPFHSSICYDKSDYTVVYKIASIPDLDLDLDI